MESSKSDHDNDKVIREVKTNKEKEPKQSICVKDIKIEPSYHNIETAGSTQSTYCEEEDQQTHFKLRGGIERVNSQHMEQLKTQKTNSHIVGEEKKSIDDILKVLQARYENKEIEHVSHGNVVEKEVTHHRGDVEIEKTHQVINSKVVVDLPFGCRCTLSLVYRRGDLSIKQVSMLHTHQVSSQMAPYYAINRLIEQSELQEIEDFVEIVEIEEMKPSSRALQQTLTDHFKRTIILQDANNVRNRLKSLQYVCSISTAQVLKGDPGRPRKYPLPHNENNVEEIVNNKSKNENSFSLIELEETGAIEIDIGETGNIQNIKRIKRINLKSPQYEELCVYNEMLSDKSSRKPNNLMNKSNKMYGKPDNSNSNVNSSFNMAFAAACMAETVKPNSFQGVMKQYLVANNLPIINHPLPDQEILEYYAAKYQTLNNAS